MTFAESLEVVRSDTVNISDSSMPTIIKGTHYILFSLLFFSIKLAKDTNFGASIKVTLDVFLFFSRSAGLFMKIRHRIREYFIDELAQ